MMQPAKTAGLVGIGNLAWNLAANLQGSGYSLEQVIGRSKTQTAEFAEEFLVPMNSISLGDLHPGLDVVFLAVSDSLIPEVAEKIGALRNSETLILHCSGNVSLSVLATAGAKSGVIWPVQTLTKENLSPFREVALYIEATENAREEVRKLALSLSNHVTYSTSEERRWVHLAAVIAGNFSNLLYHEATKLLDQVPSEGLSTLTPLILETLRKSIAIGPEAAMTGPAIRGDGETMKSHLKLLEASNPKLAELYRMISEMIGKMRK